MSTSGAWRTVTSTCFSRGAPATTRAPSVPGTPNVPLKVTARVTCAQASEYNFLSVTWTGRPDWVFANAGFHFTGTSRTGSSFIHLDGKTGYIEVATQDGCSWTVTITQVVRAYVPV